MKNNDRQLSKDHDEAGRVLADIFTQVTGENISPVIVKQSLRA